MKPHQRRREIRLKNRLNRGFDVRHGTSPRRAGHGRDTGWVPCLGTLPGPSSDPHPKTRGPRSRRWHRAMPSPSREGFHPVGCPRGNPSCPSPGAAASLPPAPRCHPEGPRPPLPAANTHHEATAGCFGPFGEDGEGGSENSPVCAGPGTRVLVTSLSHPARAPLCDPALSPQNHRQPARSPSGENRSNTPSQFFCFNFFKSEVPKARC